MNPQIHGALIVASIAGFLFLFGLFCDTAEPHDKDELDLHIRFLDKKNPKGKL